MRLNSIIRLTIALSFVMAFGVSCAGCQDDTPVAQTDTTDTSNGGFNDNPIGESDGPVEVAVAELETVYFDYDQATIRGDQKDTLRGNASAVQAGSWTTVVVEGHCDERGSEEYNLALGERRANSVRQYLVDSGVDSSRIDTVSFGEARAAAPGHSESAWAFNRRAEFRVVR